MEREVVCVINTLLESGVPAPEFVDFCAERIGMVTKTGVENKTTLLYLVESEDKVKKAEELLDWIGSAFKDHGIETVPEVRVAPMERLASEINRFKPEVVLMADSKHVKGLKNEVVGLQMVYPHPNRKLVAVTAGLGIASLAWYAFMFGDLDLVNRFVLAGKFYSGIVVGVILVVTVMIYGTFIGNVLRFMGLDTKSAH